jgi:hypothetical protein
MCTLIILRRSNAAWPLIIAANRDEQLSRAWRAPARHWPDRPNVVAGLDLLGGGTWLGVNDAGVIAAMLNRKGTLGPATGKRSRGLLPLDALKYDDAESAARALSTLEATEFRAFNMAILDRNSAVWLRSDGSSVSVNPVPEGISMLTHAELNDQSDPRIRAFLPRFRAAPPPEPDSGDFRTWQSLLARRATPADPDRETGLTFRLESGFGTSSATIIALSRRDSAAGAPERRVLFAPGPPDEAEWTPISSEAVD